MSEKETGPREADAAIALASMVVPVEIMLEHANMTQLANKPKRQRVAELQIQLAGIENQVHGLKMRLKEAMENDI